MNPCCTGSSSPSCSSPSTVRTCAAVGHRGQHRAGLHRRRRPARPRRRRSWTCRSPSACRSARARRGGSGPAAAAARRRGCTRSPLTVIGDLHVRPLAPGPGGGAAQHPGGQLAGQVPLVVDRAALVGGGLAVLGRDLRRPGRTLPRRRLAAQEVLGLGGDEVPGADRGQPDAAPRPPCRPRARTSTAPAARDRPVARPGGPPSRRRCRRRGPDRHAQISVSISSGRDHGLVRAEVELAHRHRRGCRPRPWMTAWPGAPRTRPTGPRTGRPGTASRRWCPSCARSGRRSPARRRAGSGSARRPAAEASSWACRTSAPMRSSPSADRDAGQPAEPVDVDQRLRLGQPQLHHRDQAVAAREHPGLRAEPGQQLQGVLHAGRPSRTRHAMEPALTASWRAELGKSSDKHCVKSSWLIRPVPST